MADILEVLASDKSHKEQVAVMARMALASRKSLAQLFSVLRTGNAVEKGTAAEVMKFVSQEKPEIMLPYVDALIGNIDDTVPRVRWGCPEAIGNIAKKYPQEVEGAIPKLRKNLNDESTVVRWCAAYALSEIAMNHSGKQEELRIFFRRKIKTEKNNGVRNVFLKALKAISRKGNPPRLADPQGKFRRT
jgi:HEAT repeat protein